MSWPRGRLPKPATGAVADHDPQRCARAAPDPDVVVAAGLAALPLAIECSVICPATSRRNRTTVLWPERRAAAILWARRVDAFCARLNPPMLAIAVILAAAVVVFGSNQALLRLHPEWAPAPIDVENGIHNASVADAR
jgi:hypothetical protein